MTELAIRVSGIDTGSCPFSKGTALESYQLSALFFVAKLIFALLIKFFIIKIVVKVIVFFGHA
jgi:hypothetical protein